MDFEVFFRLKNTELARYQFAVETPTDIQAGFINALEAFRVQRSIRVPTASLCVESLNALPSTELRRRRSASDMPSYSRQRSRS